MKGRTLFTLGIALLCGVSFAQEGNRQEPPLVRLMLRAAESMRYSGTLQVVQRDGMKRSVTKQYILRDGRKSRTWFPKDSPNYGEVIVEDGRFRKHYLPAKNRILVSPVEPNEGRRRLMGMVRGALFEIQEGGPVANRATKLVVVKEPKGRVRQRLWVDAANGMVLKRELLDGVGSREGYFEFLEVDLSPRIEPGDFQISRPDVREITLYDLAKELAQEAQLSHTVIPPGYGGFHLANVRLVDTVQGKLLHQTYTSPHGIVSLFQTSGVFPKRMVGGDRLRSYHWQAGRFNFLLLGAAPPQVLQEIATKLGAK